MIKLQLVWSGLIKAESLAGKSDMGFKSALHRFRKQILSCWGFFFPPITILLVQIVKTRSGGYSLLII